MKPGWGSWIARKYGRLKCIYGVVGVRKDIVIRLWDWIVMKSTSV